MGAQSHVVGGTRWGIATTVTPATYALPHDGGTYTSIVLPIASWERRFIWERQFIDTAEGDDSSQAEGDNSGQAEGDDSTFGGGGDGGSENADGLYGMMLMSSTHHRFAGLFTIRKPGAPPVTQLLVRGSPA